MNPQAEAIFKIAQDFLNRTFTITSFVPEIMRAAIPSQASVIEKVLSGELNLDNTVQSQGSVERSNQTASPEVQVPLVFGLSAGFFLLYLIFSSPDNMFNIVSLAYPLICTTAFLEERIDTQSDRLTSLSKFTKYWIVCAFIHILRSLGLLNPLFAIGLAVFLVSDSFNNAQRVYDYLIPSYKLLESFVANKIKGA